MAVRQPWAEQRELALLGADPERWTGIAVLIHLLAGGGIDLQEHQAAALAAIDEMIADYPPDAIRRPQHMPVLRFLLQQVVQHQLAGAQDGPRDGRTRRTVAPGIVMRALDGIAQDAIGAVNLGAPGSRLGALVDVWVVGEHQPPIGGGNRGLVGLWCQLQNRVQVLAHHAVHPAASPWSIGTILLEPSCKSRLW